MNRVSVAELTSEAFASFGAAGAPRADGGHGVGDVALDLARDFYNLELTDTNTADYTAFRLSVPVEFGM